MVATAGSSSWCWRTRRPGARRRRGAEALFLLIGAQPSTDWLPPERGAGRAGLHPHRARTSPRDRWPLDRAPFALETSMPGVFAAGDIRHGSVKRVASAVGEGSIAVQLVHQLFAAQQRQPRGRSAGEPDAVSHR